MKSLIKLSLLVFLAAMISACEEESIHNGQTQFEFAFQSESRSTLSELPAGSLLIINLQSSGGQEIEKEINADFDVSSGQSHRISLWLPPASYSIADFLIVDENDRIVYASPKRSSSMGEQIKNPDHFSVQDGNSPHLNLILVDSKGHKAENFGFKSFHRKQLLNVSVSIQGSNQAVTGTAVILKGESKIATFELKAKNNQLKFEADKNSTYTLEVRKSGYTTFSQSFNISDIKGKGNKPVNAIVAPALTMLSLTDIEGGLGSFQFDLAGKSGVVHINWGDGTSESAQLDESAINLYHDYATSGNHQVEVTGDLDHITYFYSFYGQGMMDAIDLRHLTELNEIRFGLSHSPAILDFSHNRKLVYAMLPGLQNLEKVILPENHRASIDLAGENKFTSTSFDDVISNLYQNTTTNNYAGGLTFAATWYQEEGDESTIATVSEASRKKMSIMKNTYGWSFYPDILD